VLSAARPASVYKRFTRVSSCTPKCTLGRQRRAGQQFSGQLRADETTQTNATGTTAGDHPSRLTIGIFARSRCDGREAFQKRKKGCRNAKVLRDPVNHDVWSLFCIFALFKFLTTRTFEHHRNEGMRGGKGPICPRSAPHGKVLCITSH
jgi:hypothetical protein